jgi:RNA polymerase sigma-70 factor (ECF subfamily)
MMAWRKLWGCILTDENPKTEQLIRRAATSDVDAMAELMAMHRDRLRKMVAVRLDQRVSPRLDPSDVVQETMLKAVAKMPEYLKDRPIEFYPWLRQLAWDQMVDSFRKHVVAQRRSVDREIDMDRDLIPALPDQSTAMLAEILVAKQSSPSRRLQLNHIQDRVSEALRAINPAYREVLVMRYLEELSLGEIAQCLGASESAIKSRHVRALKQLAKALDQNEFSND